MQTIDPRIYKAIRYMHSHFKKRIRLLEVSRQAGLSIQHFSHLLPRHTGSRFTEYARRLRTKEARRLLQNLDPSITEVSLEVSYKTSPRAPFQTPYRRAARTGRPDVPSEIPQSENQPNESQKQPIFSAILQRIFYWVRGEFQTILSSEGAYYEHEKQAKTNRIKSSQLRD